MDDAGLISGTAAFGLLVAAGCFGIQIGGRHQESTRFQTKLFLIGFGVRYGMALALYQMGLVNVFKDEDASGWLVGKAYHEDWANQGYGILDIPFLLSQTYAFQNRGYYYMLGGLFHITYAPSRLAAAAFNCFTGALTVVLVYKIARVLFSEAVARRAGWWTCFYPALIMWSSQTVKEPVVILLETVALYGCVCLRRYGISGRYCLLVIAAVVLLLPFRFYAAYVAGVAGVLSFILPNLAGYDRTHPKVKFIWLAGIPLIVLTFWMLRGEQQLDQYDLEYVDRFRAQAAVGQGSGVDLGIESKTPEGFVGRLALGGIYLLFAPFPWMLVAGSQRMLMVGPEVMLWYWLVVVGVWSGLRYAVRHRLSLVLPALLFLGAMGILYSLLFANVGLAYRQRAQLMPWFLVFAAVGLELRHVRNKLRRNRGKAQVGSQPVVRPGCRKAAVPPMIAERPVS
jgi:hypothetical protein